MDDVYIIECQPSDSASAHSDDDTPLVFIDPQAAESCLRGADVFAPGVLAAPPTLAAGQLVRLAISSGQRILRGAIAGEDIVSDKLRIGIGRSTMSRREMFRDVSGSKASGVAISVIVPRFPLPPLADLHHATGGRFVAQNLPSYVAVHVLDARPGHSVLDACAAPGGKASHIASLLCGKGCLVAVDKSPARVAKLKVLLREFNNVHAYHADSTELFTANGQARLEPASFDRVLVDAPCSGSGLRPKILHKGKRSATSAESLLSLCRRQRAILGETVKAVAPGGLLVYCTCSITLEENEDQIAWLLSSPMGRNFRLVEQQPYVGEPGFSSANGLRYEQSRLCQRFHPISHCLRSRGSRTDSVNSDTIGFFIAKLKRIS